jgi:hypothetical protein
MVRPLRIEVAGALYHVTSRGDRREVSLEDHEDRERSSGCAGGGGGASQLGLSVGRDAYLLELTQYVLLTPVQAGVVAPPSASPEAFERYETGTRHIRRRGPVTARSSTRLLRGRLDASTGWCRDAAL